MKALRDLVITVLMLSALVAGLAAVPIIFTLLVIIGVGFLVYAAIHDHRIEKEAQHKKEIIIDGDK